MDTYFRLKTIFGFYIPIALVGIIVLAIIGLLIYAKLHYELIDKNKISLMTDAGYKREVRDVASCGDKAWYHWIKRGSNGRICSGINEEEFEKMRYKDVKDWIANESK